jgi:Methyltransferase domain
MRPARRSTSLPSAAQKASIVTYADIPGYSGFLPLYDDAVAHFGDGAIFVEVGVALGHSIAYLARKVLDAGHTRTRIYAVDPWEGYARNGEQQAALGPDGTKGDFRLFLDQMAQHAPEELERIRIIRAESTNAARFFKNGTVDMALIDGAHDHESVLEDISVWSPKILSGGWLCGDDHEPNYPGVEQACNESFMSYEVIGTSWRKKL